METRGPSSTVHSLLVLFLLLVALALVISNIIPRESAGEDVGSSLREISSILAYMLLATGAALMTLAVFGRNRKRRKSAPVRVGRGRSTNIWLTLAIIVIVMMVLPFVITNSSWFGDGDGDADGGGDGQDDGLPPEGGGYDLVAPLFMVAAALSVLALFFISLRNRERHEPAPAGAEGGGPELGVVRVSYEEIASHTDVRAAIMSAYKRMLLLQSDREGDCLTADELADMLVNRLGWPCRPTASLTRLFEEAKYSEHSLGEAQRRMAVDSLVDIERWLAGREVKGDA